MTIQRMDHFTILTRDAKATAEFYGDILGFTVGERPNFPFSGIWLWNAGRPVLHVIERASIPEGPGVLDHMAFWGTGLADYIGKLKAKGIKFDLRRLPEGGFGAGTWQLFFLDPSGARVEIDLDRSEVPPPGV